VYGPPADPRLITLPAGPLDAPLAWALCVGLGVLLVIFGMRGRLGALRAAAFIVGAATLMTAPAGALWAEAWWGDFPTVDKAGSFAFYLKGAHRDSLPWGAADTPALRLIGAHAGHLWTVAAADLLLQPAAATNLISFLQPILGWGAAAAYLRATGARPWAAVAMGMPFGLGLHVLRDVRWYTLEKAAVFWLPLWLWSLERAARRGAAVLSAGLIFCWMAWNNLYFGMVGALMGLGFGIEALPGALQGEGPARRRLLALTLSAGLSLPLIVAQMGLQGDGPSLGGPERFLAERAALDVLSLWPPEWNRLELWRAIDPTALVLGLLGLGALSRRRGGRTLVGIGVVLAILALGPKLAARPGAELAADNPLYALLLAAVPGAWRIAKPEVFFEGSLLVLLVSAAARLSRHPTRTQRWTLLWMIVCWFFLVRAHPVYPGHSAQQAVELDPRSAEQALQPSR
jgi:hypothetical protein